MIFFLLEFDEILHSIIFSLKFDDVSSYQRLNQSNLSTETYTLRMYEHFDVCLCYNSIQLSENENKPRNVLFSCNCRHS